MSLALSTERTSASMNLGLAKALFRSLLSQHGFDFKDISKRLSPNRSPSLLLAHLPLSSQS